MSWLWSLAFALGNTLRFSLFSHYVIVSSFDVISIIFIGYLLYKQRFDVRNKLFLLSGIFFAWIIVSTFGFNWLSTQVDLFYNLAFIVRFGMYLLLMNLIVLLNKPINFEDTLYSIVLISIISGLIQYFFLPDVRILKYLAWDDHFYRLVGMWFDPGFMGLILASGILWHIFTPIKNKLLWATTFVLNWLALGLTYSRSSFLSLLIGLIVAIFFAKRKKIILFSVIVVLLLPVFLPKSAGGEGVKLGRSASVNARVAVWQIGLQVWQEHFWVGVGMNNYRQFGQTKAPDSSLLFVATTTGAIGLALVVLWLLELFKQGSTVGKIFLLVVLVHSQFLNSLWFSPIMVLLALLSRSQAYFHKHRQL